jgi:hypothetical protein
VKLLVIVAIVLGAGALLGTRRETPFMRWGIVIALVGIVLLATSAIFTFRGVTFGLVLTIAGVCVYYFGRVARRERLFISTNRTR